MGGPYGGGHNGLVDPPTTLSSDISPANSDLWLHVLESLSSGSNGQSSAVSTTAPLRLPPRTHQSELTAQYVATSYSCPFFIPPHRSNIRTRSFWGTIARKGFNQLRITVGEGAQLYTMSWHLIIYNELALDHRQ